MARRYVRFPADQALHVFAMDLLELVTHDTQMAAKMCRDALARFEPLGA